MNSKLLVSNLSSALYFPIDAVSGTAFELNVSSVMSYHHKILLV